MDKKIYIITGCTASGKTDFSLKIAEQNNAEIISCDSLLVYKNMNIGTAKPAKYDLEKIKHYCIDICDISEAFNIKKYIKYASSAINEIIAKGKNVLVVGGTGFYLKSFFAPVIDTIIIPQAIEEYVNDLHEKKGFEAVVCELTNLSKTFTKTFDIKNPRRVIPALKRCLATGKSVQQLSEELALQENPFNDFKKHTIFIERNKNGLQNRSELRINKMFDEGLIKEVECLLQQGIKNNYSCASSICYRETIKWLENPTTIDELKKEILQNTMHLIKKQTTWFKNQIPIDDRINIDADNILYKLEK